MCFFTHYYFLLIWRYTLMKSDSMGNSSSSMFGLVDFLVYGGSLPYRFYFPYLVIIINMFRYQHFLNQ